MKKIIFALFMASCVPVVEYPYHRTGARPSLTEDTFSKNYKLITIYNPFNRSICVVVDCDDELDKHVIIVNPNSKESFTKINNGLAKDCALESWQ